VPWSLGGGVASWSTSGTSEAFDFAESAFGFGLELLWLPDFADLPRFFLGMLLIYLHV
jgi:hypothetical protein